MNKDKENRSSSAQASFGAGILQPTKMKGDGAVNIFSTSIDHNTFAGRWPKDDYSRQQDAFSGEATTTSIQLLNSLNAVPSTMEDPKEYPVAPFVLNQDSVEQVGLNSGDLELTFTDFVLPGKNGFDLALTRRYSSSASNEDELTPKYEKKGRYTWIITFTCRCYNSTIDGNIDVKCSISDTVQEYRNNEAAKEAAENAWSAWEEYTYSEGDVIDVYDKDKEMYQCRIENVGRLNYSTMDVNKIITNEPKTVLSAVRSNSHWREYGLGHGWEFGFPSIEVVGEKYKADRVKYYQYLHLGDGRTYCLDGNQLKDYELKDLIYSRIAGTIAGREYNAVLTYQNGKTAYFQEESKDRITLIAMQDRFGNNIFFDMTFNGGCMITDTLGRSIVLSKAVIANGYTLTWTLPDKSSIVYTVENDLLTKVRDQAGRITTYGYEHYPTNMGDIFSKGSVRRSYKGDEFSDTAVEIRYKPLTDITYPTGVKSEYIYEFFDHFRIGVLQCTQGMMLLRRRCDSENDISKNQRDYVYGADQKNEENIYDTRAYLEFTQVIIGDRLDEYNFYYQKPMYQQITTQNNGAVRSRNLKYEYKLLPIKETVVQTQSGKTITTESKWSYDTKGNMLTQSLPLQGTTTMTYDTAYGLPLSKSTQKDSSTVIMERNVLTADKKAVAWKYIYENSVLWSATQYEYDSAFNLVRERVCATLAAEPPTPAGNDRVTTYSYANTNPALNSAVYNGVFLTQKSIDGVRSVTGEPLAAVTERRMYDTHGRLLEKTDAANHTTRYEYDVLGRTTKEVYPKNNPQNSAEPQYYKQTQYNDVANHIVTTDENGQKRRLEYTPLGKIKRVYALNPETLLFEYGYDMLNRLVAEYVYSTDGTAATTYAYDALDRILTKTATGAGTESSQERYTYDDAYDPARQYTLVRKEIVGGTACPSIVSTVLKDVLSRACEEATGNSVSITTYDNIGNVISKKDPNGNTILCAYDCAGRVISETRTTQSGSITARTEYDALGNKSVTTDFRGKRTTYSYDVLGRLLEQRIDFSGAEKMVTRYAYDPTGNILRQSVLCGGTLASPIWRETAYTYDSRGRVLDTNLGNSTAYTCTRYEYDPTGNKTAVYVGLEKTSTDGAQKTTYAYDRFGNVTTTTDPIGNSPNPPQPERRTELFTYDTYGRLRQKQDRNGVITTYMYDCLGRVLRETVADTPAVFRAYRYTKTGQKAAEENEQLAVSYAYDDHGRLTTQTETCRQGATNSVTKRYTYDACGNRATFILEKDGARQLTLSYTYDAQNRLAQVWKGAVQSGTCIAVYSYDANGNRVGLTCPQSGIATVYTYNDANLVTELVNKKDGTQRGLYQYRYAPDGNQTQKLSRIAGKSPKTTNYTYDSLGRLTVEQEQGGGSTAYAYDRFSNRARMTVTDVKGKATVTTYEYDMRNRLQKETKLAGETTETLSYRYDYNGNQVHRQWERFSPTPEKKTPGRAGFTSDKFKEGIVILEMREYNGFNELVSLYRDGYETRYAYRPDGLRHRKVFADGTSATHLWDGQSIVAEYAGSGNITARYLRGINLIAREQDGLLQYYLYNAHGDVVQRTDQNGTALQSYEYDAFGNEQTPEPLDANPFRYCGEYFDREAETLYLRARCYDARTGRFTREDPAKDGLNWYTYCGNNPILFVDPTGCIAYSQSYNALGGKYYRLKVESRKDTATYLAFGSLPYFGTGIDITVSLANSLGGMKEIGSSVASDIGEKMLAIADDLDLGRYIKHGSKNASKYIAGLNLLITAYDVSNFVMDQQIDALDQIISYQFGSEMLSNSRQLLDYKYLIAQSSVQQLFDNGMLTFETDKFGDVTSYNINDNQSQAISELILSLDNLTFAQIEEMYLDYLQNLSR